MSAHEASGQLCYAARMLRPYNRLLSRYPQIGPERVASLDALDPDARVPIAESLQRLQAVVALTGDEDIGLKAAREITYGDYGVVEYLVSSAPTMRSSVELLARYLRLVNDALVFSLHVEGDRAVIQLDSRIALPRAGADFQSAAFYVSALQRASNIIDPEYEAWFTHPQPANVTEYERTFSPGRVRFSAPFNGFVFCARMLNESLASADVGLQAALRQYADRMLADLVDADGITEKVRAFVRRQLAQGEPSAASAARALHMSRRTLARKLAREDTSFSQLLDETRRSLALGYLDDQRLDITELAFLLGYSQAGAFFRAFRRWTGTSPNAYRREARTR
ncbi:MAG: AraC family transcriptional regulator ligand-binding domain-containing protein [Polyangiales bacterium]